MMPSLYRDGRLAHRSFVYGLSALGAAALFGVSRDGGRFRRSSPRNRAHPQRRPPYQKRSLSRQRQGGGDVPIRHLRQLERAEWVRPDHRVRASDTLGRQPGQHARWLHHVARRLALGVWSTPARPSCSRSHNGFPRRRGSRGGGERRADGRDFPGWAEGAAAPLASPGSRCAVPADQRKGIFLASGFRTGCRVEALAVL